MTTPRDDIAGLSERLRRLARVTRRAIETSKMVSPWSADSETLDEAAAAIDALKSERDALQERVKELDGMYLGAVAARGMLRDRAVEAESRALRAEQERDEAYERAASLADEHSFAMDIEWWLNATKKEVSAVTCRSVATAIRRLAGPEKEKK